MPMRAVVLPDQLYRELEKRGIVLRLSAQETAGLILRKELGLPEPPPKPERPWPPKGRN